MNAETKLIREIAFRVRAMREGREPRMTQEEVGAKAGSEQGGLRPL